MVAVANAKNCDVPAKTRPRLVSRAKETAGDTGKRAKDQSDVMCAANCGQLASTRTSWANKAKGIAVGIARLAEVANPDEIYLTTAAMAHAAARRRYKGPNIES